MKKNRVLKIIKEIVVTVIILIIASEAIGWWRSPPPPKIDIKSLQTKKTINGENLKEILSSKKPILINFWGTWCPVCKAEAGNIQRVSKIYPVITIAVNSGDKKDIERWVNYPTLKSEA